MSDRTARQPLSRADQLRQQREQSSRVPVMPVKKTVLETNRQTVIHPFGRSTDPSTQQPMKQPAVVTSRSCPYTTPLRQSVSSTARRKVYRVDSNGVETRFPALPNIRFSWQWVSGSMTFILSIAIILMVFLPVFEVKNIQVQGLERVPVEEIQQIVLDNSRSIFTLDTRKIENIIGIKFSELVNLSIKLDASGNLLITANERQPILAWNSPNRIYWFDAEGVMMNPRGEVSGLLMLNSESSIPLLNRRQRIRTAQDYFNLLFTRQANPLTPQDVIYRINPEVLLAAINLSTQMPSGAILVYDSVSGIGWQDPRGWQVYFGLSLEDIEFKIIEYQAIVDRLSIVGVTPAMISVEHIDSPYYRME